MSADKDGSWNSNYSKRIQREVSYQKCKHKDHLPQHKLRKASHNQQLTNLPLLRKL